MLLLVTPGQWLLQMKDMVAVSRGEGIGIKRKRFRVFVIRQHEVDKGLFLGPEMFFTPALSPSLGIIPTHCYPMNLFTSCNYPRFRNSAIRRPIMKTRQRYGYEKVIL
jgi:hypothetical protein